MAKEAFPTFVPPMLATSLKKPFDSPDWIFELKLDGYRAITLFDPADNPHIWSRNALSLEQKFPGIAKAVSKLKLRSTVLDGEIVAVDENGNPGFQLLQRFQKQPTAPTLYYVFDVLWSDGEDITGKTIMERRTVLERIIKPTAGVQLGTYVDSRGIALFNLAKEKGMEGIKAKRKDGIYYPDKRTPDWLKIKSRAQQEFVVGGFTEGRGSRQRSLGALLLGAFRDGNLHYFGHSGSGFREKGLKEALEKMKPFFTSRSPFDNSPKVKEKIQWLKSNLVCEVAYAEITADEQLRQTTLPLS